MFLEKYINFSWYYLTCKSHEHVFHKISHWAWNHVKYFVRKLRKCESSDSNNPQGYKYKQQSYASGEKTRTCILASKVTIFTKCLFCFTLVIKSKGNLNQPLNHYKLSTSEHPYPAFLDLCHSLAYIENHAACAEQEDNWLHNSNHHGLP